jgi:hypothetical protein
LALDGADAAVNTCSEAIRVEGWHIVGN